MLARDEQVEIDIVSQSKQLPLEQTQQYQDDCDFVDQYRKENPGWSDEVRLLMNAPENQVFLQSIYQKYGYENNSLLRHK
jgi:hypothetical protein